MQPPSKERLRAVFFKALAITRLMPDSSSWSPRLAAGFFVFTPDVNDTNVPVVEVSIPGDYNSNSQPFAWLWQAERWVIVNNNLTNPIYYDGTTGVSRRAVQGSSLQATSANTSQPACPPIGGTMLLTMQAPGNLANFLNQVVQIVEYDANANVVSTTDYELVAVGGSRHDLRHHA